MPGADAHGSAGADDLRAISGIGARVATALEQLGIDTFDDLAGCTAEELSSRLRESGLRISPKVIRNSNWIGQAKNRVAARERDLGDPSPEDDRPPAASAEHEPGAHVAGAAPVDDVQISVDSRPAVLATGGRPLLEATVSFASRGDTDPADPENPLGARVRVYAVSLADDARRLVSIDEIPLGAGEGRRSTQQVFECPPRGRYRFEAIVQALDARGRATSATTDAFRVTV